MAKSILGGVEIINTLSTKNDGAYPLVKAESVGMNDGATAEDSIKKKLDKNQGAQNNGKFMKVGADGNLVPENVPVPDVSGQINSHNTNNESHTDIRELVAKLTERLNTLMDSEDVSLDQLSEIVSYIKNNKTLIEQVTTNKLNVTDVVNNLTTNVESKALSAAMGVELKRLIDSIKTTDASAQISEHDKSKTAHADIRTDVTTLKEANAQLKKDLGNIINTDYEDGYIIDIGGNKVQDDGYKILKIICYRGKNITFSNTVANNKYINSISFYNIKNQFISGIVSTVHGDSPYTSSVPDTAYYAIFTCLKSQNVSYRFDTDYVSAFLDRTNEIVRDYQNADNNKLDVIRGKNLFNKNTIIAGKFLYDNGGVALNNDYFISDYIQIEGGEQYYIQELQTNGANNVFYDLNKNALDKSYSNQIKNGGFTAPKSAAYICLSGRTQTVNNLCFSKGTQKIPYEPYTDYKPIQDAENKIQNLENRMDSIVDNKTELQSVFAQSLSAGESINLDVPNIKFDKVISFHANVILGGEIEISHGQTAWYSSGKIRIDSTSVKYYSYTGHDNLEIEVQHGLTISNTVSVALDVNGIETMESGMPRIADLIIESNGKIFKTRMKWNGCYEKVQAKIISGNYENCSLNFWSDGYKKDIWAYGDSYFDYWPLLAKKYGYGNFLCDGVSGRGSNEALKSLKLGLTHGTPKKIFWCMGMNDPDNSDSISATYKKALDEVIALCDKFEIELIITTIPNVPDRNHNYKNEYIKSLGKRIVDVAKAVGADNSANWFDGFLSDDKVHPTGNIGANAIVGCIITNVPELLETN